MLFILFTFALLSSAITSNKIILYAMSPSLLVAIRMFFGGLILFLYNYFSRIYISWQKLVSYFAFLLFITLCTTFVPSILKAYGLKGMVSSKAAFLGALDPFITPFFSYFFFSEKLNLRKFLGIILGFAGASIIIFSKAGVGELDVFWVFSDREIAVLAAIIISRFGWILIQKLLKEHVFSPTQINTSTMLISGILSFLMAVFFNEFAIGSLSNVDLSILKLVPFKFLGSDYSLVFFILYTIIVGNVFAYNLYAMALKKYSANFVSLVGFSIPIYVHFFGWIFLNEQLSLEFFIACGITFLGLLIFYFDEKKIKPHF